jgi:hypothetical protein
MVNDVFYVNTFNNPNKLSDDRFLVVWMVELLNVGYKEGQDAYKFIKKVYDTNNKFKGGEVIDPDKVLIVHGKKYLITQLFEYWRSKI